MLKNIYLLGICGTGMGNFALMLKEKGYNVSGSDKDIYPPMSTKLISSGIEIKQGYSKDNLTQKPDLVIIGNVIRRDNEEAVYVMENKIEHLSMPQALRKFFFDNKETIVVTGTHGKTTTSFFISWLLETAKLKPGFFIGGIPKNFSNLMGRGTDGKYFVIEGDEYDTVYYDKVPKFYHYNPKYLVINGIEFDHGDIYKDIESIIAVFEHLIKMVPSDGLIIYNADDSNVNKIITNAKCKVLSFSSKNINSDYFIRHSEVENNVDCNKNKYKFLLKTPNGDKIFRTTMPGKHNILNAVVTIALAEHFKISDELINKTLETFSGVKRRLDVYAEVNGRIIMDDFAHHPTAISYSIDAVNTWYKDKKIWCVFEPRTATSRTNVLQPELIEALMNASNVLLAPVHQPERVELAKRFDPEYVCKILKEKDINAVNFKSVDDLIAYLLKNVKANELILIMSNGGFNNIYEKLVEGFKSKE